ncbi:MAG: acyltransferase family protein [Burkholderiaceae bacterium]
MEMALRNYSIDVARGGLMLYIVFIIHGLFWLQLLPRDIASAILFEMPCIFIISGYAYFLYQTSSDQHHSTWKISAYFEFLVSRLSRILVPYFVYALFAFGICVVHRQPEWTIGEIFLSWVNPIRYGQGYSIYMLNWHLWFISPFLAVTALLPFLTKLKIQTRVPLWVYMVCASIVIYLSAFVQFDGVGLIPYIVFYSAWAIFGYHLAKQKLEAGRKDYLLVFLLALAALVAIEIISPKQYSLDMQANKFPPNFVFFIFCSAWVALLLMIISWLPKSSIEKLATQKWLSPFIANGYSIYIWQGLGYSLASFIDIKLHLPAVIVWVAALFLSVLFGTLAAPFERLRVRRKSL